MLGCEPVIDRQQAAPARVAERAADGIVGVQGSGDEASPVKEEHPRQPFADGSTDRCICANRERSVRPRQLELIDRRDLIRGTEEAQQVRESCTALSDRER